MEISIDKEKPFWQTKVGYAIRWVSFIPGAAISAAGVNIFIMLLLMIGDLLDGSIWIYLEHPETITNDYLLMPFIYAAIFGGAFVYVGTSIAPAPKKSRISDTVRDNSSCFWSTRISFLFRA